MSAMQSSKNKNPEEKDSSFTSLTGFSELRIDRFPRELLQKLRTIANQAHYRTLREYLIDVLKKEANR